MKVTKRTPAWSFSRTSESAKRLASRLRRSVTKPLSWAKLQKSQVALHIFVTETLQIAGPPCGTSRNRSITPVRALPMHLIPWPRGQGAPPGLA